MRRIARALGPVMQRLFPGVPVDHPAMSAMILNISSNMLGLGNAATPFGIRAMEQLDTLNGQKGTATNAMVLFLAINTAGLAILPSGVIGLRASLGSQDAAGIFLPTLVASASATLVGILAATLLSKLPRYRTTEPAVIAPEPCAQKDITGTTEEPPRASLSRRWMVWIFWLVFLWLLGQELIFNLAPNRIDASDFPTSRSVPAVECHPWPRRPFTGRSRSALARPPRERSQRPSTASCSSNRRKLAARQGFSGGSSRGGSSARSSRRYGRWRTSR